MKKKTIIIISVILVSILGLVFFLTKKPSSTEQVVEQKPSLPINDIPISERPFITLTPDATGRNITLLIDNTEAKEILEYELVYQAGDKQEGAFGRIDLSDEELPVEKKLLLGSKSAGGSVTYHEGITGGSLTVTYNDTKLKESFNFLRFDKTEEEYNSVDGRLTVTFPARSLVDNDVIIMMKSFGLPLVMEGDVIAGPYAVLTSDEIIPDTISIKLSSVEDGITPTLYEYSDGEWIEVESDLENSSISANKLTGNIYVVVSK